LAANSMSASLIGRLRSSTFRLSAAAMSMSLTGSRFSSESAPGPFHHGIRGRGRTIFQATLSSGSSGRANLPHPSSREGHRSPAGGILGVYPFRRPCRQVQADVRTYLIHRPARDIVPLLGGFSSFLLSGDLVVRFKRHCDLPSSIAPGGTSFTAAVH